MSLILLSLSVAASASVDIIYTQGDTMIKGIVSAGELEYATEATVTVFDEDGNLNYMDKELDRSLENLEKGHTGKSKKSKKSN